MSSFHFLRPEWLLVIPVAWLLAWFLSQFRKTSGDWGRVMDGHLLNFLIGATAPRSVKTQRWVSFGLMWTLLALALAGPAWERLETPVLRAAQARVVILDLSWSMLSPDVKPNRLERTRFKLLDLLKRFKEGDTALVAYAGSADVVAPLTPDTNTIANLVPVLEPSLMPVPGSRPEQAFELAASLLTRQQIPQGTFYWLTDGLAADQVEAVQAALGPNRLVVLAVGSESGAPIPTGQGEFIRDAQGRIVVPQLKLEPLQQVAEPSGGGVVPARLDDQDLDQLVRWEAQATEFAKESDQQVAERWRDEGIWLVLAAVPFAAWLFRRGMIWMWWGAMLLLPPPAQAFKWQDLWQRPDQQGQVLFDQGVADQAAEAFENPEWQGVSHYRAGNFEQAAQQLEGVETARAQYNRGNALAKSGKLQEALDAYDQALALSPDDEDTRFNRDLVQQLLDQQQSQQQNQQQQNPQQSPQQPSSDSSQNQQSGQQQQQSPQQGQQQNSSQGAPQSGDSGSSQGSSADSASANAAEKNPSGPPPPPQNPQEAQAQQQANADAASPESQASASADEQKPEAPPENTSSVTPTKKPPDAESPPKQPVAVPRPGDELTPQQQQLEQALRQVPNDPGRLLRNKFRLRQQQRGRPDLNPDQPFW